MADFVPPKSLVQVLAKCLCYYGDNLKELFPTIVFPTDEIKTLDQVGKFMNDNYGWLQDMEPYLELVNFNPDTDYQEYLLFVHLMNLIRIKNVPISDFITKFTIIGHGIIKGKSLINKETFVIIHFGNKYYEWGLFQLLPVRPIGIKVHFLSGQNIHSNIMARFISSRKNKLEKTIFKKIYSQSFFFRIQCLFNEICNMDALRSLYVYYYFKNELKAKQDAAITLLMLNSSSSEVDFSSYLNYCLTKNRCYYDISESNQAILTLTHKYGENFNNLQRRLREMFSVSEPEPEKDESMTEHSSLTISESNTKLKETIEPVAKRRRGQKSDAMEQSFKPTGPVLLIHKSNRPYQPLHN
jgi:hypothetical protein